MPGNSIQIDRLWAGEAGTAPWRRKQGQVTRAQNVRFDIAIGGAVKRNPTQLIADLAEDSATIPFDGEENFRFIALRGAIIAIGRGLIYGWDQQGLPLQIDDQTNGSFATYTTANPLTNLLTCASHDTVIVLNRNVTVEIQDAWTYQQSYNFIVNGNANDSAGAVNADPITAGQYVDTFDELELLSTNNGDVYRVLFDHELDPSGVYVKRAGAVHANAQGYFPQHGQWHRIPQSGQGQARYVNSTMPHQIVYDEDAGTLTLDTCLWRQRVSGNQQANERMPFVGDKIRTVEFQHGRLFLISNAHVCSSRHRDFFNLWVSNVNAKTDEDRIALDITESGIGNVLRSAVCGTSVLIITENVQLEFHSGNDPLTNVNGRMRRVGSFQARDIDPAVSTNQVVLVDEDGDVHRFDHSGDGDLGIVYREHLNIHRRKLLFGKTPFRPFLINQTLYLTLDEDDMLVHESFSVGGELVQSAWSAYEMQDHPVFVGAWAGRVNVVTRRYGPGGRYTLLSYIHKEAEPPTDLLYMPRMDRMELIGTDDMEYDQQANRTVMFHTGADGDEELSCVVLTSTNLAHKFLRPAVISSNGAVEFTGDLTNAPVWLGFTFDTELVLTKLYPGLTSQGLNTQRFTVFHYESTDYALRAVRANGEMVPPDAPFNWQPQRTALDKVGVAPFQTHFKDFTFVCGDLRRTELTLSSSSPGQCAWLGLEYEAQEGARGTS